MTRGRSTSSIIGSPVLVGAITMLIVIVAVFLAYNANAGLPFVPTYDLNAQVPSAANLVPGNEVRIGGHRVGGITDISPLRQPGGNTIAVLHMKLDRALQPLPVDTHVLVRARSALGLKYLEITPGNSAAGFRPGDTMPLAAATPRPVEIDEVFNMFDAPTRRGIRRSLGGYGTGFAGRGAGLNEVISQLPQLLFNLDSVTSNLADRRTRLRALFPELGRAARIVAPVSETQARLFENLDTTFGALARVARPFIQDTIAQSPPFLETAIQEFPLQRPFLENTTAFARELRPGVHVLPTTLPDLASALHFGRTTLRRIPPFNRRLASVFRSLEAFATDPLVPAGVKRLTATVTSLEPTLKFLTPVQLNCNYVTLWFRNTSGLLSEGDGNGTWQRFIIVATPQGPNSESGPSSAPANGPTSDNYLHSNTYPNFGGPGQPKECEAGNENYIVGKKVLGNAPGTQSTTTSGQVK
ncbi:MAG: phospholipid/cholesterol/gamma-HCH transport system substrate-binding protein [Solirubrobacteraceae bacterium]|nr:phospholipid/cholesterol/gamma-HCH transport system substrate-binding protein [Solirubrobacteraceae bacterium]